MTTSNWKARVHPELRATYRKVPNLTFGPWSMRLFRTLERLRPSPRLPGGVSLRQERIGDQRLRLFYPEAGPTTPAALLWIHGGGRILGSPRQVDHHCLRLTRALGIVTAAASYRLAPEHPFPAALDDLEAAWTWMLAHAQALGVEPERIAVGGESAGGGLAAELTQRLRDQGGPAPRAQVLVYPMLDDRTAADPSLTAQGFLVWNNRSNHFGWSSYLGVEPGRPTIDRYAAAARCEDLTGLPPAWLTVGDIDLFLAENERYLERLRRAGVPTELHLVPGGFHGYFSVGTDEPPIQRVWSSLLAFLREHL